MSILHPHVVKASKLGSFFFFFQILRSSFLLPVTGIVPTFLDINVMREWSRWVCKLGKLSWTIRVGNKPVWRFNFHSESSRCTSIYLSIHTFATASLLAPAEINSIRTCSQVARATFITSFSLRVFYRCGKKDIGRYSDLIANLRTGYNRLLLSGVMKNFIRDKLQRLKN